MPTLSNSHPFDNLIQSTRNLHKRFGTAQSIRLAIRIFAEEWREVRAECYPDWLRDMERESGLEATRDMYEINTDDMAHETADLMVTLIGLCDLCGVTSEQLNKAMLEVAAKNDAKIPGVTHEINTVSRKIQRIRNRS